MCCVLARPCARTRIGAKYLPAYTARALLLLAMHRAGVGRLGGLDTSVAEFATAFPDERQWFMRLSSSPTQSVREFLSSLDYTGRPELFSMFSCLLLTKSSLLSPTWFEYHARVLRQAMHSQKEHGLMRVPSLCVQDVLRMSGHLK